MNINTRLNKLESTKNRLIVPSVSDIYTTQTKATYNKWLVDNNPGLTLADIEKLKIKHFEDMYE